MTNPNILDNFWHDLVEPPDHTMLFKLGDDVVLVQFRTDMTWCFVDDDGVPIDFTPPERRTTGMNMIMKGHAKATVTGPDGEER